VVFLTILPKVSTDLQEQLEEYFAQFGHIKICKIICKHDTQVSRGFGFVIFTSREAAEKVIQHRDDHYINGKWVDCKSAILRQEMLPPVLIHYIEHLKKKEKEI
jgi:RNA recognition motif-containing protein